MTGVEVFAVVQIGARLVAMGIDIYDRLSRGVPVTDAEKQAFLDERNALLAESKRLEDEWQDELKKS